MKLIIGLGNPGDQFINTRHNLGFEVLDTLTHKLGHHPEDWNDNSKLKSQLLKLQFEDQQLLLAKPQTFMNNSGQAVRLLLDFDKISPADLIVVHDDLDLKLGQLKLRQGGSAAGHHGVESIIEQIGTDDFIRLRLGIEPEHTQSSFNVDDFVTNPFDTHEKSKVKQMLKRAVEALETLLSDGLTKAQNQYH